MQRRPGKPSAGVVPHQPPPCVDEDEDKIEGGDEKTEKEEQDEKDKKGKGKAMVSVAMLAGSLAQSNVGESSTSKTARTLSRTKSFGRSLRRLGSHTRARLSGVFKAGEQASGEQ